MTEKGSAPRFSKQKDVPHYGLPGMCERASKFGAQLELWSRPEAGTEIELTIPAGTAYQSRRAGGELVLVSALF
jgi:nitrate/nitrite-specific signal transduction histidine kinase